jgi:hypothetical protein
LGQASTPDLEEAWERRERAETALWLDYKSLFVFADVLLGRFVSLSEPAWEAPSEVEQHRGLTKFLVSVEKVEQSSRLVPPFADYMTRLRDRLQALDNVLGVYRDVFVIHVPPDLARTGAISSMSVPLDFERSHGRGREPTEDELQRLRAAVRKVEDAVGHPLCPDEEDPRPRLWGLTARLGRLKTAQAWAVKDLVKEWGMRSPPASQVAEELSEVLEVWATMLGEQLA